MIKITFQRKIMHEMTKNYPQDISEKNKDFLSSLVSQCKVTYIN